MGPDSSETNQVVRRPTGILPPLLAHHPALHFAPRFRRLPLFLNGRGLEIFPPLDFLHDAVSFAFALETAKGVFDRLSITDFD